MIPDDIRDNPQYLDLWLESFQGNAYQLMVEYHAIWQILRYGTWIQRTALRVVEWLSRRLA